MFAVDVLLAGGELVPTHRLADYRLGNLLPLWKTTQRDGEAAASFARIVDTRIDGAGSC